MKKPTPAQRARKARESGMLIQRKLDPRKGPTRGGPGRARGPRELSFDDVKFPLLFVLIAAGTVAAYILTKPYFAKREGEVAFNACLSSVNSLRAGLENHRTTHKTGYGVMDLFSSMGASDNGQVEQQMSKWCMGKLPAPGSNPATQDTWWEFISNLHISAGASFYVVTAYTKTEPPCLISADPNRIWPPDFAHCGQPPPTPFVW